MSTFQKRQVIFAELANRTNKTLSLADAALEEILILRAKLEAAEKDAARIKKVAEGVKQRCGLRGFLMPEDASDLLDVIHDAARKEKP